MKTMTLWLCNVCLIYAYQEISRVVIKLWVNWSNILKNLYKIYRMPFHIPLFQFIFKLLILNAQSEAKAFLVSSYKLWKSVATHVNSLILANEKKIFFSLKQNFNISFVMTRNIFRNFSEHSWILQPCVWLRTRDLSNMET